MEAESSPTTHMATSTIISTLTTPNCSTRRGRAAAKPTFVRYCGNDQRLVSRHCERSEAMAVASFVFALALAVAVPSIAAEDRIYGFGANGKIPNW